jgi:hypothetical protein
VTGIRTNMISALNDAERWAKGLATGSTARLDTATRNTLLDLRSQANEINARAQADDINPDVRQAAQATWSELDEIVSGLDSADLMQQTSAQKANVAQIDAAAQRFSRTVGFVPQETEALETMALVLAHYRGADLSLTMNLLTQALSGNMQAADALNLQLDAGYVAYTQINGSTREVFQMLDPSTQNVLRYRAALAQVGKKATGPELDQLRRAETGTGGPSRDSAFLTAAQNAKEHMANFSTQNTAALDAIDAYVAAYTADHGVAPA